MGAESNGVCDVGPYWLPCSVYMYYSALIAVRAGMGGVTGVHTSCSTEGTLLGRHALIVRRSC